MAANHKPVVPVPDDEDHVMYVWLDALTNYITAIDYPDETSAEFKKRWPVDYHVIGQDITRFHAIYWPAFLKAAGLALPKHIFAHGFINVQGQKMSKTKGNVIDPLDLIRGATFEQVVEKALPGAPHEEALKKFQKAYPSVTTMGQGFAAYGADSLRFSLASHSPQARRVPLSPKKIETSRNFCNKLWNATRFAMSYLGGYAVPAGAQAVPSPTLLHNRWLLARLGEVMTDVNAGIADFRLDGATQGLYHFVWGDLCDWYLELSKPILGKPSEPLAGAQADETRAVLAYTLEVVMRALHPFIPFLSEELWQKLPRAAGAPHSIAIAAYPTAASGRPDAEALQQVAALQAVISAARSVRSEHQIHPGAEVPVILRVADEGLRALAFKHAHPVLAPFVAADRSGDRRYPAGCDDAQARR